MYKNYIKMEKEKIKKYTITKKVAKHGNQAVIVIPKFLQDELKPKTVVEVSFSIVKEAQDE